MNRNIIKKSLLVVLLVVIVEGILWGSFRAFEYTKYKTGKKLTELIISGQDDANIPIRMQPYLFYWNNPKYQLNGKYKYNNEGYRNPGLDLNDTSYDYRILCIGASTTNCLPYVEDEKKTWPSLLSAGLSAHYHKRIQVINAGLPGGSSAEFLTAYLFKHKYLKPNLVILEAGGNDILSLFFADFKSDFSHWRRFGMDINTLRPLRVILKYEGLSRIIFAILYSNQPLYLNSYPLALEKSNGATFLANVQKNSTTIFSHNIDALTSSIGQDSSNCLLVNFVEVSKSLLSKHQPLLEGSEEAQDLGYRKITIAFDSLSVKKNLPYCKLSFSDFTETDFIDNCHLNEHGEKKKAEIIYKYILSSEKIGGDISRK